MDAARPRDHRVRLQAGRAQAIARSRATARTSENLPPSDGSKSRISPIGVWGSAARDSHVWIVTTFWPAR